MSVLATDNFPTDGADLGAAWDVMTGEAAWKVLSNAATPTSLASDSAESNNSATWPNDQYAQTNLTVTFGTAGDGSGVGIGLRMATGSRTYYRIVVNGSASNNIEISRFNTGYGLIGQLTSAWSAGDVLKVTISGSSPGTISVYKNGSLIGSATDSAIASGRTGVAYSSTTGSAILDNWEGGDLTTANSDGSSFDWLSNPRRPAVFAPGLAR